MDDVRLCQGDGHEVVHMSGKIAEASLIAHEAMDIYEKKTPTTRSVVVGGFQRQ